MLRFVLPEGEEEKKHLLFFGAIAIDTFLQPSWRFDMVKLQGGSKISSLPH